MAQSRARSSSWVQHVRETSDAMDLPPGIFTRSPRAIAHGLKSAVVRSRRTKGTKFQSAMSMLNLYINRSGRRLAAADRARLTAARAELRRLFRRHGSDAARKRRAA
jgi:hypothetical protein